MKPIKIKLIILFRIHTSTITNQFNKQKKMILRNLQNLGLFMTNLKKKKKNWNVKQIKALKKKKS